MVDCLSIIIPAVLSNEILYILCESRPGAFEDTRLREIASRLPVRQQTNRRCHDGYPSASLPERRLTPQLKCGNMGEKQYKEVLAMPRTEMKTYQRQSADTMTAKEKSKMQRRDVLKTIGATFLVSTGSSASAYQSKPHGWKTAFGLNGFASSSEKYGKVFPVWEVLDFAARARFDGIELHGTWPMGGYPSSDEPRRINALKRLYEAYGLQIFSIQTGAGGAFSPAAVERKRWLDEFRDRAKFAKTVGCDCIGMWPGGRLRGQTLEEAIEHLASSFREAAKIAHDLGLVPAFEIEPVFLFNTEEHLQQILEKANHPALKTIYDPSHFDLMNGSTGRPDEMLRRIGLENIGYVHFTDTDGTRRDEGTSKHLPCGDGHIDVQASLSTLWQGGFRGWMNIDAWQIPDPYDACLKGKQAIDFFLASR